ncbi:molybdopterin-guanine dinucleotide biosynthesis protein B [Desulfofalx alkaliphila]|uniref:molybdopterin-guanine dinucleotide biosynthesis protein B n=1 Tax=Desulfofalx alkaliphila TaxID=105483 RepID=UPI001A9A52A3|nr:molybdopterin-guanine dinucleotide biosynthesis protein B [Desulfofalx alkaliphila]
MIKEVIFLKVFSVFGVTQSGKTTTVEKIINELCKRGYRVGSIKNIHFEGFALDTVGTNTWRHKQAGAEMVVARGLMETDVLIPQKLPLEKILTFFDHDYVVMEGISNTLVPKILCVKNEKEIEERKNDLVIALSGRISNVKTTYKGIPVFNALLDAERLVDFIEDKMNHYLPFINEIEHCQKCGSSCRTLASQILKGKAKSSECMVSNEVTVKLGSQEISLDYFQQLNIKRRLEKVFSQLDSYDPDRDITIKIRKTKNGMAV